MADRRITRNLIRCRKCNTIIESVHRHDFKWCPCGQTYVDGGKDYVRIGGALDSIEVLTEYADDHP